MKSLFLKQFDRQTVILYFQSPLLLLFMSFFLFQLLFLSGVILRIKILIALTWLNTRNFLFLRNFVFSTDLFICYLRNVWSNWNQWSQSSHWSHNCSILFSVFWLKNIIFSFEFFLSVLLFFWIDYLSLFDFQRASYVSLQRVQDFIIVQNERKGLKGYVLKTHWVRRRSFRVAKMRFGGVSVELVFESELCIFGPGQEGMRLRLMHLQEMRGRVEVC